jgi:hypothetical protein
MEEFMGDFNQIRKKALKGEFSNFVINKKKNILFTRKYISFYKFFSIIK